ncbi:hypothetical protein EON67_07085 [archaeon]|nr:MAG: hypothetical protein EON67_07085 [archaeon]
MCVCARAPRSMALSLDSILLRRRLGAPVSAGVEDGDALAAAGRASTPLILIHGAQGTSSSGMLLAKHIAQKVGGHLLPAYLLPPCVQRTATPARPHVAAAPPISIRLARRCTPPLAHAMQVSSAGSAVLVSDHVRCAARRTQVCLRAGGGPGALFRACSSPSHSARALVFHTTASWTCADCGRSIGCTGCGFAAPVCVTRGGGGCQCAASRVGSRRTDG